MICVWNDITGDNYDDMDLFSSTSTDGGVTWSTPINFTNNQAYNARLNTRIVGSDVYTAVSSKMDGLQSDIVLYHSADLGISWDDAIMVCENSGTSSRPDLRVVGSDTNKRIYITWTDDTYGEYDRTLVTVSYDNGASWSDFETISQEVEDAYWAKILVNEGVTSDNIYIVYDRNLEGTMDSEVWGRNGENSLVDFAHIIGTVSDTEGSPIENATVTAGGYFALTNADGSYQLDLLAGTYDVTATALGYQFDTDYDVEVAENETATVDFILADQVEGNYPPFNLNAQLFGASNVKLTWEEPLGYNSLELSYDDGIAEAYNWVGTATGNEYIATAFSYDENYYLRRIKALYKSDTTQNIQVKVLADNGGVPDLTYVLAGPFSVEVDNTEGLAEWLQIDLDLPLAGGTNFYIAIGWDAGTSFVIGADQTEPDGFSYSTNDNGNEWFTINDRDFMIRAGIDVDEVNRDLLGYNIYRNGLLINEVLINDFDYIDETAEMDTDYNYHTTAVYSEGESSPSNIASISIAAPVLFPPVNLTAETSGANVNLSWDLPGSNGEEIYWDSGVNQESSGGETASTFDVAIRFDTSDLASYVGKYLTKMTFFLNDNNCQIFARVWNNGSQYYAGDLIWEQEVTELQANALNEVEFPSPIEIEADKELWIGYRVINEAGNYPAGCDLGPAVPYKGDMLLYGSDWVSTYDYFGWDLNWNIRGYVVSTERCDNVPLDAVALINSIPAKPENLDLVTNETGSLRYDRSFTHYNLYRDEELLSELNNDLTSWEDTDVEDGTHTYYLTSAYEEFESNPSNTVEVEIDGSSTDEIDVPLITDLIGNYPNPFNPVTNISFQISEIAQVTVDIYNIKGEKVKTLVNERLTPDTYNYSWNGTDDNSNVVSSGVYFYKMKAGRYTSTRKMILMK